MRNPLLLLVASALMAGCGGANDAPVGGLTAEEASQLNNAAEMLDLSDGAPANEAEPTR